ncbi:MAG: sulfotransferase [Marinobacter sp.]|uniref:sulfotransferase n=1 Tax=Marinobacter sp. TaxID=50741 RepID=UPI003C65413F
MPDENRPLNILVAGIYWSGSGAVVDYLKGHPDCCVPRGEFTDFKRSGRIGSILEADSVSKAKWLARAMWIETALGKLPAARLKQARNTDQNSLPLKAQVKHNRLKLHFLSHYRKALANGALPSESSIWNQWMQAVGDEYAGQKRAIVWNQPIWVGKHERTWPAVFSPFKLIVVHRDPVDQFAEVVRQGKIGKRKSDPAFDDREKDDIAYVLKGIAAKMQSLMALQEQLTTTGVLAVSFEAFVKRHKEQAGRVCDFLGLPEAQLPSAPFNPDYSVRNIGIGDTAEIRSMLTGYQPLVDRLYELRAQFDNAQ